MEQRVSNGSFISIHFSSLSFYASDKNSFFRGERKRQKKRKKKKKGKRNKNERIKDSRKSFATVFVMTEKKRERKRRRREEDTSVVLSSLIGTRPVLSARCQSIIENARRLDERRRDRHRYIYIYDPTRQNSQLQESVRIST